MFGVCGLRAGFIGRRLFYAHSPKLDGSSSRGGSKLAYRGPLVSKILERGRIAPPYAQPPPPPRPVAGPRPPLPHPPPTTTPPGAARATSPSAQKTARGPAKTQRPQMRRPVSWCSSGKDDSGTAATGLPERERRAHTSDERWRASRAGCVRISQRGAEHNGRFFFRSPRDAVRNVRYAKRRRFSVSHRPGRSSLCLF